MDTLAEQMAKARENGDGAVAEDSIFHLPI